MVDTLGTYTVANIIKIGLFTLTNEKGETLHEKCMVSLLKRYFSDKICQEAADKKPSTNPNKPLKLDFTPLAEEKPNRNLESKIYFQKLPDDIVKNILVLTTATTRETPVACCSQVQTSKRFSTMLERSKHKLLPDNYLQLPDDEIKKLPCMCGKLKVSVRKILKHFGQYSGVGKALEEIIKSKKWITQK